jgi:hypothetical protein
MTEDFMRYDGSWTGPSLMPETVAPEAVQPIRFRLVQ